MHPILRLQDLRKSYGDKAVLQGISLDIYPGQIIGYIGPNGAGKSTTVKILTGIIQDYEGTVLVDGADLREQLTAVKQRTGYIPELAEMYDLLTPREYLNFIGRLYHLPQPLIEARSAAMLDSFGLLPNLDQRMDTFSKGMKQKVLLTAGLLHNPDIVILDEPLSGLDANAVILVKELLQVLKSEGKTIFYCSHMMDVVEKVSDRIVLINGGSIVAHGTIDELRGAGSESLEQIFSRLTSGETKTEAAAGFALAFERKYPEEA